MRAVAILSVPLLMACIGGPFPEDVAGIYVELTPNGGHLISMERGVHNAETQTCVPAGVPAADH
jgi:hypothetical protein